MFIYEVLLKPSQAPQVICGCFCTTRADLTSCKRDSMAAKKGAFWHFTEQVNHLEQKLKRRGEKQEG